MTWMPLLQGPLAEQALETAAAIGDALTDSRVLEALDTEGGPAAADLAGGRAGLALFLSYLTRSHSRTHESFAADLLNDAILALETTPMSPSLHGGFTGVAWVSTHLMAPDEADDPNAEIDEALIQYLRRTPWTDDYDLISGLVGVGVYALERRPHARADSMLALILDRLAESAHPVGDGVTWHTAPALMSPAQRAECPAGHYNLGVAHGVPGVIALLGYACHCGHEATARPLLEGAVAWLLHQRLDPDAGSVFPRWIAGGRGGTSSRLAWCYGDVGVAATLLVAARGAGRPDWEREALLIARHAADRPAETTGVRDAGLCHGAAGLAHMFNRMYQATGEAWLADRAQRWFVRTLEMRQPDESLAGFLTMRLNVDRDEQWVAEPGLLNGAAGIGLALAAACSSIEPAWDLALLLSVPGEAA